MTTQSPAQCPNCGTTRASCFVRDGAWTPGVDNLVCFSADTGKCAG